MKEQDKKQVLIEKCSNPSLWYKNYVGEIFTIEKENIDVYWTRERDFYKSLNFILKVDANVLTKEN